MGLFKGCNFWESATVGGSEPSRAKRSKPRSRSPTSRTPRSPRSRTPRPRSIIDSQIQQTSNAQEPLTPQTPVVVQHSYPRRVFGSLLQNLRNIYDFLMNFGHERGEIMLHHVPENSISNIIKMIFLPVLLLVIVIMMLPLIESTAYETFNAIFYNDKVPENRNVALKKISVGTALVFDHVVKKIFPIVRLRWANRKLFKRRVQVLPPVPQQTLP